MALTSDEANYLVYRYLQESGFAHSAFTFGYESFVRNSPIDGNDVPPGALISIIQKGLQYLELEANLTDTGEVDGDFSHITTQELISKEVDELKRLIRDRRANEKQKKQKKDELDKTKGKSSEYKREKDRDVQAMETDVVGEHDKKSDHKKEASNLPADQTLYLEGHSSEVFICAWSPTSNLLASGSGDACARIWDVPTTINDSSKSSMGEPLILKHYTNKYSNKSKDVTTLDWSGDGTQLATGSYDGQARVWSSDGKLLRTLNKHKGPIFSLKWNKKSDLLLSGSVDKTAIVWDARTGDVRQVFSYHSAPTLDVDWRNNVSFATCSTDKMIYVCKLGEIKPVRAFQGHSDEVNAIKWDPSGNLLASCSDDNSAKIWSVKQDTFLFDLREHEKEIYTIKWSPTGPGSANPNQQLVLASASFDATVRLWEVETGKCVYTLANHSDPVYSVAFSPDGKYMASGSFDRAVNIWSVKDGELLRTINGPGGIFEVCWNKDGTQVAACFSTKSVVVVDVRM